MRAILPKNEQVKFMNFLLRKISVGEAAKLSNLSERTIRDWRRAKFSMDLNAIKKICLENNVELPKNIKIKDDYWYASLGAHKGAMVCLKKYGRVGGDAEKHKQKWREWWEREGKYKNFNKGIFARRSINKPAFSKSLAEFVGILLGDGGISETQVQFTFHSEDDIEYAEFVVDLLKKLFGAPVGSCRRGEFHANVYYISRKELVSFCIEKLGLKKGNKVKQQVDIPAWILNNKMYSIACVRGLVDTDGCVFNHKYRVGGKEYQYKKLSFTNSSHPLLNSVYVIMKDSGLRPRFANKAEQGEVELRLDSIEDMGRYFKVFSSHNPKHLKKYYK